MKKVLPLIKNNLLSLIAIVLAILLAPAMWFVSSGWRVSVHKQIEDKVRQDLSRINSVDVTYQIPAFVEGVEEISVKAPPNSATTAQVSRLLQDLRRQVASVRTGAIDLNSEGKTLLVGTPGGDQLFPQPTSESVRLRLLDDMVDIWPAAHRQLLRDHHAGDPPSVAGIRTRLETDRRNEVARIVGGRADPNLIPEEEDRLAEFLGRKRLEYYRQHANGLSFYATDDVFDAVQPWDDTQVLPVETAWDWQHLYWVHADIIRGVAHANRSPAGFTPVHRAPVKRVLSIAVGGPEIAAGVSGGRGGRGGRGDAGSDEAQPASVDDGSLIQRDFSLSHTGRISWPAAPNPMFDIRFIDLEMLVDSTRLPRIIEAFGQVNFMTVVGLDIEDYDPAGDLRRGYDYGPHHIVKASLRIETLWLRSWLGQYMPAPVREINGIPDPQPDAPEGDSSDQNTDE